MLSPERHVADRAAPERTCGRLNTQKGAVAVQITFLTRDLGRALADATKAPTLPAPGDHFDIKPLEFLPGAAKSFWCSGFTSPTRQK